MPAGVVSPVPIIVNVLPLPVCPYAKIVAFLPRNTPGIIGFAVSL